MIEPYRTTFAEDMWIHPMAKVFIIVCLELALYFLFNAQFLIALLYWSLSNFVSNRQDRTFERIIRYYMGQELPPQKSFFRIVNDEEESEED